MSGVRQPSPPSARGSCLPRRHLEGHLTRRMSTGVTTSRWRYPASGKRAVLHGRLVDSTVLNDPGRLAIGPTQPGFLYAEDDAGSINLDLAEFLPIRRAHAAPGSRPFCAVVGDHRSSVSVVE